MNIKYKINNEKYKVIFCPDNQGIKIRKKIKSYMQITKDLKKIKHDGKVLLVMDKNIDKRITNYMVHDLRITYKKLYVLYVKGSKINKNLKTFYTILNTLFKNKFTKNSVLISCGGGVVGDVSGLVSSLYLRGLIYLHVPTTMTALIDSCIGGKTGINYKNIINSIGNYYHPKKVYISKNILKLLPEREYIAGIPELIKCGLINDQRILDLLQDNEKQVHNRNFNFLVNIIKLSLKTKIKFFINDIIEKNERLKLNFGHTFAHAIESSLEKLTSNKRDVLRHGEAVGLGLLCEIFYINNDNHLYYLVKNLLKKYSLPINLLKINVSKNELKKQIYKFIFLDKKKISKYPRYIELKKTGKTQISEMKDFQKIKKTINLVLFNEA